MTFAVDRFGFERGGGEPMAAGRKAIAVGAGAVVAAALVAGGAGAQTTASWQVTQVVSGLNAPRGIAVDGHGGVYVAEAGVVGSGDFGVTKGAVDKYAWSHGTLTRQWSTPFNAIYASEGGGTPDALGPAGLSTTGPRCGTGHAGSCALRLIESVNREELLAMGGPRLTQIGHLFALSTSTGHARNLSDVGDRNYRWTANHKYLWEEFPDSNPYGVLVTRALGGGLRTFVADAGANTVSEVFPNGTSRVISYIPNETPPGTRDSTPTCVAVGPDHMLYVGTLDLLTNFQQGGGQSHVWRVNPNSTNWRHNATIWASGLTTVSACTFDRQGNFWAAEMFYDNGSSAPPGDLVRIPFHHPTQIQHVGNGSLLLPGGVAVARDGSLYVSTGAAAGNGQGGIAHLTRG
jgi:hypothetical protein